MMRKRLRPLPIFCQLKFYSKSLNCKFSLLMLVLIFYIVKHDYYIVGFSAFILTNCTKSNTIIIGRAIIVHIKCYQY